MTQPEKLNQFPEMFNKIELYERNEPPIAHFPEESVTYFYEISSMRTKSWASSARVNPKADSTGLIGELSFFKWLGYTGHEALEDFTSGLKGDSGIDCYYENMAIDIKTTFSKDQKLKYIFTKSNRNANRANVIVFVKLMETMSGSVNAWLLAWSWKHDIIPYLRDSEKYPHIQTLYLDSLKRNKVLYPISHLLLNESKEVF